jgi:hypothetical protein
MFNFPWPNAAFSRITENRLDSGHPYPITRSMRLVHQLLDDEARWSFLGQQFDKEILRDIIFAGLDEIPYYLDYEQKSVSKWQETRCSKLAGYKLIPGQINYAFYFEPESSTEPLPTDAELIEMIDDDLAPDGNYYYF